ncbi:MAG TPA: hypothetical protein VE734_13235 [Terriglobales bacterium]|nr:hypothetical protein [Terriglobales bacterium]
MKGISKNPGGKMLILGAPPLAATFFLWLTRLNEITVFEFLASAALLATAWIPYYRWRVTGERYLPVFPMLSFMYWVYYVLALFWGARRLHRELAERSIEQALLLAAMGVACLWLGKWMGIGRRLVSRKVFDIEVTRQHSWSYIRAALLISLPLTFVVQSRAYLFGSGGRQLLVILASTVSMALFVLLFRKLLRGQANHGEILLISVFLIGRFVAGIASGWLGTGAALMVTCAVAYLYEQRKVPTSAVVLVLAYILFFQAGKETFRKTFWGERVDSSVSQRISFWSSESLRNWELTLRNPNTDNWRRLADRSLGRLSLLQQTAHVLDLTPDEVPFQYGRLYSYMLVTLIPRAVWPEKPSVNDANRFYQVAYGLTDPEHLDTVSIAVGTVAESFINFGWWGPLLVMIPLGIFFDYLQHAFLARDSGWVLNAIGIALIPTFLTVESQLAQYLAGILQCIAVVLLVLWPVLHTRLREGKNAPQLDDFERVARLRMPLMEPRRFL